MMNSCVRILAASVLSLASGCASGPIGSVELAALGARPLVLERSLSEGVYAPMESECGFWFSDIPFEALERSDGGTALQDGVMIHAQVVWKPEPGRTPLSATATNVVTRVIVVSAGEVGLYGGAGFARLDGDFGSEAIDLDLRGSTLTLLAKSGGFHDLLSPMELRGRLVARRAPEDALRWRRGLSQFATNAFGRSMWVSSVKDACDQAIEATRVRLTAR